jgi:hypothetical protein
VRFRRGFCFLLSLRLRLATLGYSVIVLQTMRFVNEQSPADEGNRKTLVAQEIDLMKQRFYPDLQEAVQVLPTQDTIE